MATQAKNISVHQLATLDENNVAYETSNGQKHLTPAVLLPKTKQRGLVEDSQKHLKTVARRAYSGQKRSARGRPENEQIASRQATHPMMTSWPKNLEQLLISFIKHSKMPVRSISSQSMAPEERIHLHWAIFWRQSTQALLCSNSNKMSL